MQLLRSFGLLFFCIFFAVITIPNFSFLNAQSGSYPSFAPPINYPMSLSGTFGELRRTGFHFGIDLRSQWTEDEDLILSIGDGHVSRISVSAGGYGKAIYIDHPNGYTSVYAHLDQLATEIDQWVRQQQYHQKSFDVNLYPQRNQFPVKMGQFLGTMGNTGHSFGKHLHFEIRETKGQIPINPLLFGYEVADHHAPILQELGIHILDERGNVLERTIHSLRRIKGDEYVVGNEPLEIKGWQFGLSIKGHDRMTGTSNRNGIYHIAMYVDDELYHEIRFDRIAYSERPYFRTHVAFAINVLDNKRHHLLYQHQGNKLQLYCDCPTYGIVKAFENQERQIRVITSDFQGNESVVEFKVKRVPPPYDREDFIYTHIFQPEESKIVSFSCSSIHFPKNGFFKQERLNIRASISSREDALSPAVYIEESGVAFYNRPELQFHQYNIPKASRSKVFIGKVNDNGSLSRLGGQWKGADFTGRISSGGEYALFIDTIPPVITPKKFRRDMRGLSSMAFEITDELVLGSPGGGLEYEGRINGEWVLFEYDLKNNLIEYHFDRPLAAGEHQLGITVTDAAGNKISREWTFIR